MKLIQLGSTVSERVSLRTLGIFSANMSVLPEFHYCYEAWVGLTVVSTEYKVYMYYGSDGILHHYRSFYIEALNLLSLPMIARTASQRLQEENEKRAFPIWDHQFKPLLLPCEPCE